MSKIKVDTIEGSTGATITVPSGQTLTVTDGIPATNLSGTIADARLPTVPVAKGGTGLTSLGSAGQVVSVNSGANALEFADASSGKLLQVKTATNTNVVGSSNNAGGKEFPSNMGHTNGAQVCSISITPQSTSSHFYCFYTSPDAANGNAVSVSAMFHGTTKKTVASANCYAGDVGGHAMSCTIDTTSLSGAQTIQARNMGTSDGNTHYTCANHGGSSNGGASVLIIMEIED
jgi:hypothetical protein